ncbi:MAG: rod shape-determining protein MreC [bacterium]|nr:rod shape-determining protein MreC [bacterium]
MFNKQRTLTLLGLIAFLFFISQIFFTPKAYLVSRLGQAFQAPAIFLRSLSTRTALKTDLIALLLENQSLRAQLQQAQSTPSIIEQERERYIRVPLYSSYPFNTSNQLLVAAGSESGVLEGATVFAAPGIFIGQVTSVQNGKAVVRTIFDPGWELPVRIGEGKVDALLIGGQEPRLTLVSKRKPLIGGESVFLASRDFTYGLVLGAVAELRQSKDSLFLEGRLIASYTIADLSELYIGL